MLFLNGQYPNREILTCDKVLFWMVEFEKCFLGAVEILDG